VPPPATGAVFLDVPVNGFAAAWIEELARSGVTAGCGPGNYCPSMPVSREQMAVFLLRALEGPQYIAPSCTSAPFLDVPCSSPFARWIQELARRQVTAGCGGGNYCPQTPLARREMAAFVSVMFALP